MIINFRQGIVSYPSTNGVQQFLIPTGNAVSISTARGAVDVTFAHRTANYLHTESVNVPNAWHSLPSNTSVWLYWDINTLTGVRTFGYTQLQPYVQPTAPRGTIDVDQHWFDTSTTVMKVWTGSRWQEVIRVFAAEYDTSNTQFISISQYSTQQRFDGTQVGIEGRINAGRIIVDNAGMPITTKYGVFFTTEDDFFINGSPINAIRLEANILTASPVENIAGYQVVRFTDFGKVRLAGYDDLQQSAIAIAVQDVMKNETGSFVVQGIITNPEWNWQVIGAPLWVLEGGELVEYDPHINDTATYNVGKAPVGRVIDRTRIIFDQGLGGKGDKGDSALAGDGTEGAATQFTLGTVKLSATPADPGSPYVVETNDPRMSDARQPLQHAHPATEIQPAIYGTNINGDLQTTLQNIENAKLNKAGDLMTGSLVLSAIPTDSMAVVPKSYVDEFVHQTQKGMPNGVASLDATGRISPSQLPQMALTDTFVVNSQQDMLLLNAQTGDLAVRTDIRTTFILRGTNPTLFSEWQELLTSPDGVVQVDVVPAQGETGIATSGGPIRDSGQIEIRLTNDLKAIESLTGTGVAHRTGTDAWEVKAVDLSAGGSVVTGVLPMVNGGTGLSEVVGYLRGNGTAFTALPAIPGSDVSGTVPSAASVPWSGVTGTPTTVAAYGINDVYTKIQTNALTWNWTAINNKPTTLVGYGITDVYSKTEVNTALLAKADRATTLAGYGITDAATKDHSHTLDSLNNVNTLGKGVNDILRWTGTVWASTALTSAILPDTISGKTLDSTNTVAVKDTNFTIEDDSDGTSAFRFVADDIDSGTTRVYRAPNADGTLVLADGFGAFGNWNINAASASAVSWTGVTSKPNTAVGYGITDVYTKSETDVLRWDWTAIDNTPTTLAGYGITDVYSKTESNAMLWDWSSILNTPTTLTGYGITDVYSKAEVDLLTWRWPAIVNTPTTLAGYGITDAATADHTHDGLYVKTSDVGVTVASLDGAGKVLPEQLPDWVSANTYTVDNEAAMLALLARRGDVCIRLDVSRTYILATDDPTSVDGWLQFAVPETAGGTVTSVDIIPPTSGIAIIGGPVTTTGAFTVTLADDLAAVESLDATGYAVRTGQNQWATQTTIPFNDVTGVVPISQGGTGQTTADAARTALDVPSTTGFGATGDWAINITGNAATVTDGVVTTGFYEDPSWIASLSADKVVGTWTGSPNVSQLASEVTYGNFTVVRNGSYTSTAVTPFVLDSFGVADFDGAKYTVSIKDAAGTAAIVDVFVTIDATQAVHISQVGAGNNTTVFEAVYRSDINAVEVRGTPPSPTNTTYRFTATLFAVS